MGDRELTNRENQVLSAIKDLSDDTGLCIATRRKIADKAGIKSDASVSPATVALAKKGFITVIPGVRHNDKGASPNSYKLNV